uniref:Uncharacterized protein n=1 Tax=Hucho hucho TaxID=62062 RepID=A0A4W5LFP2_9TELE
VSSYTQSPSSLSLSTSPLSVCLSLSVSLPQGEFERGVQDCDSALCVCEGSRRALYRKALCLRELGRLREAYECGTGCLLTAPHDRQVGELAQDLANKLGLKVRKAYISSQVSSVTSDSLSTVGMCPSKIKMPRTISATVNISVTVIFTGGVLNVREGEQ